MHTTTRVTMLATTLLLLSGCRLGGSVSTETALNTLRQENTDLKSKLALAEGTAAELRTKLDASGKAATAALPVCTRIEIGGLSGWSKDGQTLELLVQTLDGRGRFVPVAATIKVTSEANAGTPSTLLHFSPDEVRELYRSGVLGTYYLVSVPRLHVGDIVKVELEDLVTGLHHAAEWRKPEVTK